MTDMLITSGNGTHSRTPALMRQEAPWPQALADLLARLRLRQPGWYVHMVEDSDRGQGSKGLTVVFTATVPDSRNPGSKTRIGHYFPVPPAAYNERSWLHWLFDRYCEVMRHEAAEMFEVDGRLPFAPLHAPGNDPYMVIEATVAEEHTDNKGRVTRPTEWHEADPAQIAARGQGQRPEPGYPTRPKGWGEH